MIEYNTPKSKQDFYITLLSAVFIIVITIYTVFLVNINAKKNEYKEKFNDCKGYLEMIAPKI